MQDERERLKYAVKITGEVKPHESVTSRHQSIMFVTYKIKNVISRAKSTPRSFYKTKKPQIVYRG